MENGKSDSPDKKDGKKKKIICIAEDKNRGSFNQKRTKKRIQRGKDSKARGGRKREGKSNFFWPPWFR